jgi:hypothetical protein
MNTNLAREANVVCQFSLHGKAITFDFPHFTRISREHFNPAGGAAGVATAAMENVDSGVFDYQNQLLAIRCFDGLFAGRSCCLNLGHSSLLRKLEFCLHLNLAQEWSTSKRWSKSAKPNYPRITAEKRHNSVQPFSLF